MSIKLLVKNTNSGGKDGVEGLHFEFIVKEPTAKRLITSTVKKSDAPLLAYASTQHSATDAQLPFRIRN